MYDSSYCCFVFFSNLGGFDFIILIKYVNSVIAMFFMTVVFIIEIVV